jgi:photosystem II stability/assembly factor-like uncharacterized protein
MKNVLAMLLAVLVVSVSFADWQATIHGDPTVGYLASDSTGNRIIVSMMDRGGIWITNDAGSNWTQINDRISPDPVFQSPLYCDIVTVGAAADTVILNTLHGNGASMHIREYHSLDGGATWDSFSSIINDFWPDSIENLPLGTGDPTFILPDRQYYARQDGFGVSHDGGETWSIFNTSPYQCGVNGVTYDPFHPDTIFLYGTWGEDYPGGPEVGGVIGSFDGGVTWARLTNMEELTNDPFGGITKVSRGAGNNLYAAAAWSSYLNHPPFLHSPDLGQTWEWTGSEGLPGGLSGTHILAVPECPGRLITAGMGGAGVWESEDGGDTWFRVLNGLPERPTTVMTIYRNPYSGHLYLCLFKKGIWRSTDFGDTWQHVPGPPIGMSAGSGNNIGLIVGEGGVLHGSRDSDIYYAPVDATEFLPVPTIDTDPNHRLRKQAVAGLPDLLIAAEGRLDMFTSEFELTILSSTDNGENWSPATQELDDAYLTTYALETDTGLVLVNCHDDRMEFSTDLGHTWQPRDLPFEHPPFFMVAGTDLFTVPYPELTDLYRSEDLGVTWQDLDFPDQGYLFSMLYSTMLTLNDTLFCRNEEDCWVLPPGGDWQRRGHIHPQQDLNGGDFDWDFVTTPTDTFLIGGTFINPDFEVSYDNGWTWELQDVEMPGGYEGEVPLEIAYDHWRDRLWVSTNMGLMYLDHPTSVSDDDIWRFQPVTYATLTSYPNPFNRVTTIRYTLTRPGEIQLDIYDLLGRHVAHLFDGLRQPGEHSVSFDATSVSSSGTYFLQLDIGDETLNQKISLVK